MPALFEHGSYDLAGYCIGILEYGQELSTPIVEGDLIIGLPSSGLHCSGFNYIYDIMNSLGEAYDNIAPFDKLGRTFSKNFQISFALFSMSVIVN